MSVKITTIEVDFAGTREEARQFVNQHPQLHLAHKPGPAGGGLPVITSRCSSAAARTEVLALLASLGWPEEAVGESVHVFAC